MRGALPPRTSELIFEMLKMLMWTASSPKSCVAASCDAPAALVIVAGDDFRRIRGEFGDSLEDVLRRVRREVGDQLVVDRQVGGQHEEVLDLLGPVQIGDERAHQPRLADARGQGETERREVSLEVFTVGKLRLDRLNAAAVSVSFCEFDDFANASQNLKRVALRLAQAQSVGDGVDVMVHPLGLHCEKVLLPRVGLASASGWLGGGSGVLLHRFVLAEDS